MSAWAVLPTSNIIPTYFSVCFSNVVPKSQLRKFDVGKAKSMDRQCCLRAAVDKAIVFLDKRELPSSWDRSALLGEESEESDEAAEDDNEEGDAEASASEESESDEASAEDRDRFVAQFYKYQDERGKEISVADHGNLGQRFSGG